MTWKSYPIFSIQISEWQTHKQKHENQNIELCAQLFHTTSYCYHCTKPMLLDHKNYQSYHVFAFLTSLLPLTPLTITFSSHGSHHGLIFMTVLSWFESYLSSRSFHVKCDSSLSSLYSSFCGGPQGSVLGLLLFIMYTTPLSTLIFPLSLNHHIYGDDTQLFLSVHPPDFDLSITHLENALQHISSWMTANLLTLNTSKTEFLLNGRSKQLAKIQNSLLNATHLACNFGFIFDEHLTFSDQILSVSKSCYYHIRQLHCIRPYLIETSTTIATSVVHSKLDYCNSLYHSLPKSQITCLQQIQNFLTCAVVKAPKSCHITG